MVWTKPVGFGIVPGKATPKSGRVGKTGEKSRLILVNLLLVGEVDMAACPTTALELRENDELALPTLEEPSAPIDVRECASTSNAAAVENAEAADRLEATLSRISRTAGSVGIK